MRQRRQLTKLLPARGGSEPLPLVYHMLPRRSSASWYIRSLAARDMPPAGVYSARRQFTVSESVLRRGCGHGRDAGPAGSPSSRWISAVSSSSSSGSPAEVLVFNRGLEVLGAVVFELEPGPGEWVGRVVDLPAPDALADGAELSKVATLPAGSRME